MVASRLGFYIRAECTRQEPYFYHQGPAPGYSLRFSEGLKLCGGKATEQPTQIFRMLGSFSLCTTKRQSTSIPLWTYTNTHHETRSMEYQQVGG